MPRRPMARQCLRRRGRRPKALRRVPRLFDMDVTLRRMPITGTPLMYEGCR
jgi:hypothetical protein